MELMTPRLKLLKLALERLYESMGLMPQDASVSLYSQIRDSVIQRFEFSVDLFWKCLKDLLADRFGVVVVSPRNVFREAFIQKLINEQEYEVLTRMVDARNSTSHRYDEVMADEIVRDVVFYYELMVKILQRMSAERS